MIKLRHIILEQSTNPKALILAGAPGAGKSSFIEGVKDALILNVDDAYMRNLKDLNVSLDLKNADAEERSKAAKAMAAANKEFRPMTREIILGKKNFILDGTAASSGPTLRLKKELEELGYDVLMVYVFASLEKALERNDSRFDRSDGNDRSLAPAIVLRTWKGVTDNLKPYASLFGSNFVAVANTLEGNKIKDVEDILKTYLEPFTPQGTKPKTPAQQEKSKQQKLELNAEIQAMLNDEFLEDILTYTVSKDEAQSKLQNFLRS